MDRFSRFIRFPSDSTTLSPWGEAEGRFHPLAATATAAGFRREQHSTGGDGAQPAAGAKSRRTIFREMPLVTTVFVKWTALTDSVRPLHVELDE